MKTNRELNQRVLDWIEADSDRRELAEKAGWSVRAKEKLAELLANSFCDDFDTDEQAMDYFWEFVGI